MVLGHFKISPSLWVWFRPEGDELWPQGLRMEGKRKGERRGWAGGGRCRGEKKRARHKRALGGEGGATLSKGSVVWWWRACLQG